MHASEQRGRYSVDCRMGQGAEAQWVWVLHLSLGMGGGQAGVCLVGGGHCAPGQLRVGKAAYMHHPHNRSQQSAGLG